VRRGGLWAKRMGLKRGVIENNLGNTLGTLWELDGNIEGTCWKQRKNEIPPPTQNLKEKKSRHLECMLQPTQ